MYVIGQENFALISAAKSISLAHMYEAIYNILQNPDEGGEAAAGNLKAWFGAASQANSGVGGASDFIRAYTQSQLEIREGEEISGVEQVIQEASDRIAESVFEDIQGSEFSENGKFYYIIPDVEQIGEKDAQETLSGLGSFGSSNAIWSGNPLFIGLGIGRFWNETVLETAGDTYDLVVAVQSLWVAGINSVSNFSDLVSLFWEQGDPGRSQAIAQVAASLAATEAFFNDAYGYFGENGLAGLFGDQRVIGSKNLDFSLGEQLGLSANTFIHGGTGNDLLVGSLGVDMLDGGADHDDASFYTVSAEMAQGLRASIFNLDSTAQFSALVEGVDVKSALFNVESLELGRHDDILEIADLVNSTTGLDKVYGGENGTLGDKIDLSDVATAAATVNLQDGTLRLTGSQETLNVYDFENVVGTSHNDVITGDDEANGINGHLGTDSLFGGGGDDFIFFDAADGANVNGGEGRDIAVALGTAGVTVDMAAQELECVIGCDGADTFTLDGQNTLFAAGGGGSDTFVIGANAPAVVWGGAGADSFVFADGLGGGIAVLSIPGLTEESFAGLSIEDLNLGGLNLGAFRAIIVNPDSSDRVILGDTTFSSSSMPSGIGWGSFSSPLLTEFVGLPLSVSGGYELNYEFEATLHVERDEFENVISITDYTGRWLADGTEEFDFHEYDPNSQAEQDEAEAFIQAREDEPVFRMTQLETNPNYGPWYGSFYVVGGTFSGEDLVANGQLTASAPNEPAMSAFDWLLVA